MVQYMECISVFDMLKIGVGPSSSHTLGPWRAAERFIGELRQKNIFNTTAKIRIELYGSLSLTGKGHATDLALMMGLTGTDPVTVPIESIDDTIANINANKILSLDKTLKIPFDPKTDILFKREFLPFHANGMIFIATLTSGKEIRETYYSIGGGFVVKEGLATAKKNIRTFKSFPFPIQNGADLLAACRKEQKTISEL